MAEKRYVRDVPEQVYESGKILRVEPSRLQILGLYTIRMMLPPGSIDYAIESPVGIVNTDEVEDDRWRVQFTMFAPENSGEIDSVTGQFTNDGHMFLDNIGSRARPEYGSRIKIGYFLGDTNKGPLMLDASTELPQTLIDLDFEPESLLIEV